MAEPGLAVLRVEAGSVARQGQVVGLGEVASGRVAS